jgi:hypothetical protein
VSHQSGPSPEKQIAFDLLPAAAHDLTAIHELTIGLPLGATIFSDNKASILERDITSSGKHWVFTWFRGGTPI